jgi:RNA polymerase sigma-70 factor (ECF subfamily)
MSALVRAFHQAVAATSAAAPTTYDTADLAGFLAALYRRGRDAHPKLRVGEEAFGRVLARCMGDRPLPSLDSFAIEDLYLACACVEGVRGAAAAFEAAYGKKIRRAVSRVFPSAGDREDAEQRVRQHLLVGAPDAGPALAKYPGHAPLAKWIPVVAIRVAISLNRSETAERRLRDRAAAEAMGASPEDLLMRAELRRAVEPAVADALGRLEDRDRLILRLFLVGGMTAHAIGTSLGLSQQAISKRIAKARDAMLEHIRSSVARELKIPEDDFSSLMRVVASQLDVNISRLLRRK